MTLKTPSAQAEPHPPELNADEINAPIARSKAPAGERKLYVTMQDSHLGPNQLALGSVGPPVFKPILERNCLLFSNASKRQPQPSPDVLVKGKLLPSGMNKLRSQIYATANEDPHASVALNRFQSRQIKDVSPRSQAVRGIGRLLPTARLRQAVIPSAT
jgi:hypothetical protein